MNRSFFLGVCFLMSSLSAEMRTINSIEQVTEYVTAGSWVVWDLEGTLFKFEDNIPHGWLTDKTQIVFNMSCARADRALSVTGSHYYLYQVINMNLDQLGVRFSSSDKDMVIYLNKMFQSIEYNGVCYSGLQSKGNTLKQYLDAVDKENLPSAIVFIDDTSKHILNVSEMMQKSFPDIQITCLHYQQK